MRSRFSTTALALGLAALCSTPAAAQPSPLTRLQPPIASACISSPFGPRVLANLPEAGTYHYGIDLPAPNGTPILSAAAGTVIGIQNKGPGGLEMLIQHEGFIGVYSHFGMIAPALAGGRRSVAAGEKLGVVGLTGVTTGPHLNFGMLVGGRPIDPAPYLGVPYCEGVQPRVVTAARPNGNYGVTIDGRKYYQLFFPEQQYIKWRQH